MRQFVLALSLSVLLLPGSFAAAWSPDDDWPPIPEPDPWTQSSGRFDEPPANIAYVVPEGIYYVTETYVADVVTREGDVTTYSTATVYESPGTYARVVDEVGTGTASRFDGDAFNGRAALGDGRAVAGTYYENFILNSSGFVPVGVVFFQDDSEIAARESTTTAPRASTAPSSVGFSVPETVVPWSVSSPPSMSSPPSTGSSGRVSSQAMAVEHDEPALTTTRSTVGPQRPRAGVAPSPRGPIQARLEVLRGWPVRLWPAAFIGDTSVSVRSWRLVSPPPDRIAALSGSSDEPFAAEWLRLAAPESTWPLRFEVVTDASGILTADIDVVVRSPALVD